MEQVNSDGHRQQVDPGMLAEFDQMERLFQDMTTHLLTLRAKIKDAAVEGDTAAIGVLTGQMDALVKKEWPDAHSPEINYIMFLVGLIEQAKDWTELHGHAIDGLLRQVGALTHPGHPLKQLPGFGQEDLERDLTACLMALEGLDDTDNRFTTDTGVTLHHVHSQDRCQGTFCIVHRRIPGPWDSWQVHWRDDWHLMVRICPHDVHHVAMEEMLRMPLLGMIAHDHPAGCDCACDFSRCTVSTDDQGNIVGFTANSHE